MPTEPTAPKTSVLGQRIAGGALLAICGPVFLLIAGNLAWLFLKPPAPSGSGPENTSALAYMICFAGLMGLLAAFGLRMILRSLAK